ncbi:hypothetical protein Tco_0718412 [Tanacetum coccineum]
MAYDSDCDDLSLAKAVLMANLSSCYLEVLLCDSNIIWYSQYLQESQDAVIQDTNSSAPNDLLGLSLVEQITDHCSVDKNDFEIQIKQLSINNDQLLKQIMSQEIVHIAVNSVDSFDVKKSCVNGCNKCLELETELLKKKDLIEKDVYVETLKRKTRVQSKEYCDSLIAQINAKSVKNSDLNAQLQEKVFAITALKNELRKLKGKNVVNTAVLKPTATIAPGMFNLDIEPIYPRLKNNRDAHEVYIEKTIEYTDTVHGFVESARTQNPSEPLLESACMFTKHVQELLVYVS